ncbi:hypothetical protein [uncultured Tenacibaculum sp.]|uniref:hypothetical protein n=1 Tax=uncultured Tenacibaculum sp. TaxID=174713 RepID=UPI002631DA79|nr:hypothetical protein [uncultured Tenacibaculum sp.]
MKVQLFLIYISIIFIAKSFAQEDITITYDPSTNLHLGASIDYNSIFDSKQDCFTSSEKEWIDGGAVKTEVSSLFISSYKEVSNDFKLSYHSDIKSTLNLSDALSGGGSLTYDFTLNHYFKNISNSIYFVVKAETSHGRLKLKDNSLKSQFQKLLDDGNFSDFITRCGTHYVRFETRKSSVYAIVSISNIEKEIKNHIISKYSATANIKANGFGSVDAKTKLDIDNLFKEISKHGRVEITYLAQGSEGIKSFSPVVTSSSSIKISEILENLSTTLADFDKDKSAPVDYRLASFKPFGLLNLTLKKDKVTFLERTQINLNTLYDAYNQIQVIKDERFDDYLLYFKEYEIKLIDRIKESIRLLKDCYYEDKFDISNIPDDKAFIDEIIWPSSIFNNIEVEYHPFYSEGIDKDDKRSQILTSLSITISGQIRHSDYYKNMIPLHFTEDLELKPTNGYETNENNPSIGTPFIPENKIKSRPFLLRIETFNLDIIPNSSGLILIDNIIIKKHKALTERLIKRKYLVNVETTDGKYFNQPIKFNFSEGDIEMTR